LANELATALLPALEIALGRGPDGGRKPMTNGMFGVVPGEKGDELVVVDPG
jgi:hypothetical protein